MKVLVVSQYFWPESFRINEVVASLADRGIQVCVLTGKPNYPDGKVFPGYRSWGCQTDRHRFPIFRVPIYPRGRKSALQLALNYLSFVASASVFGWWALRRVPFDVVLVYAPSPLLQALPALFLSRLRRCPLVVWVQDLWPESLEATGYVRNGVIISAIRQVVTFLYKRTDLILVSSRPFERSIRQMVPTAQIAYYPNSVDSMFCDPDSGTKPDVSILDDGFNVVFAGNLGTAQAVSVIVAAAEKLVAYREIRLVVLGSGSELEWMKRQIVERNLQNLHLAGRFPVESMPFLLARASALLVTLADRPIFAATVPNKIQAYMAVGRPIIACLKGEGARIVTKANAGIAVQPEDANSLADAIVELYEAPPAIRAEMGANGRAYYREHFDHERLISELIEHLSRLKGRKV
jgi:glycosyltransferase involved in cell wall biosynthesis